MTLLIRHGCIDCIAYVVYCYKFGGLDRTNFPLWDNEVILKLELEPHTLCQLNATMPVRWLYLDKEADLKLDDCE